MRMLFLALLFFSGPAGASDNFNLCRRVAIANSEAYQAAQDNLAARVTLQEHLPNLFLEATFVPQTVRLSDGTTLTYSFRRENSVRDIMDNTSGSRVVLEIRHGNIIVEVARETIGGKYEINTYRDTDLPLPFELTSSMDIYLEADRLHIERKTNLGIDHGGLATIAILCEHKYSDGRRIAAAKAWAQELESIERKITEDYLRDMDAVELFSSIHTSVVSGRNDPRKEAFQAKIIATKNLTARANQLMTEESWGTVPLRREIFQGLPGEPEWLTLSSAGYFYAVSIKGLNSGFLDAHMRYIRTAADDLALDKDIYRIAFDRKEGLLAFPAGTQRRNAAGSAFLEDIELFKVMAPKDE